MGWASEEADFHPFIPFKMLMSNNIPGTAPAATNWTVQNYEYVWFFS